jgi:FkbM family methyltransferase
MSIIKSIIKTALNKAGYDVYQKSFNIPAPNSMNEGLHRLKTKGVHPSCIIDVGAAQGTWTTNALQYWPDSNYKLVEPLIEQQNTLEQLKALNPNIDYYLAVAGEEQGEVSLTISDDLDGSGIYGGATKNSRQVPVISIDDIAGHEKSCLIKLDTHGYEVPILKGAAKTLQHTHALIIEVYGFRISPTCLLFHELTAYLETLGFRLVDLVDIMRRPTDNAFWQADAIYIRKDHVIFSNNNYA